MPLEAKVEQTDNELVARTLAGETEAFEEIYKRYYRKVYCTALGVVKRKEDAEDITNEVMKKALEKLETYRKENLGAWLAAIAKHESYHLVKEQRRQREKLRQYKEEYPRDFPEVKEVTLLDKLKKAIDMLPQRDKDILKMQYGEGLNFRQIGQRLGIQRNTAYARGFRIKRRLKKQLRKTKDQV